MKGKVLFLTLIVFVPVILIWGMSVNNTMIAWTRNRRDAMKTLKKVLLLTVLFFISCITFAQAQSEYGLQITNSGSQKWGIDWSPDGEWITYAAFDNSEDLWDVWIVPAEGGTPVNLTEDITDKTCFFPDFHPNSKEIIFSAGDPHEIFNINIETLERSIIENAYANAYWSHDGRYIVFIEWVGKLRILDINDGSVHSLLEGDWNAPSCFTVDDRYVISTRYSDNALYIIPVEGGSSERLTNHEGMHWYPNVSSDGKWVTYTVWPKEGFVDASLYAMNLESGDYFPIFPGLTDQHYCGCFSPDGKKLCYLKEIPDPEKDGRDTIYEVFVAEMNLQGVAINESNNEKHFSLSSNHPNPFNPITTISYQLNKTDMVNLVIYDLLGRKVETLVDEMKTPGSYAVTWNAQDFASGVYFYRIEFGGSKVLTQKMLLMK